MTSILKSEIRKLLSVRSTYFVSILALAVVILLTWVMVWDLHSSLKIEAGGVGTEISQAPPSESPESGISTVQMEADRQEWLTTRQREVVMNAFSTAATFVVIIIILQIIHEYRYNTIIYTLTTSRSRTKVFVSKAGVLLAFSLIMGLAAVLASLVTYKVAYGFYDISLPAQNLRWVDALLRGSLYSISFASIGIVIAFFSRNIALAIAVLLIFPSTVESLLGIWLKGNAVYLPFSAMSQLVLYNPQAEGSLDFKHALLTTALYLTVLLPLTWFVFLKRDAN